MENISIITICRNNLGDLIRTCESVENQEFKPFEHYIVDGSTNSEIKKWLNENNQIKYRFFVCEPDEGISDAFNKGIRNTNGDILVMLNSGDTLYDKSTLKYVLEVFKNNPEIKWLHGCIKLFRGGKWVEIGKRFEEKKLYRGMRSTFHQTMYVKRELYQKYGLYDISIKIAMDYDFLCRIRNEKFKFLNKTIAEFDPTGISTTKYVDAIREASICFQKYFGNSLKHEIWLQRQLLLHKLISSKLGKTLYSLKVKLSLENL